MIEKIFFFGVNFRLRVLSKLGAIAAHEGDRIDQRKVVVPCRLTAEHVDEKDRVEACGQNEIERSKIVWRKRQSDRRENLRGV